jgi:thymidine kinase
MYARKTSSMLQDVKRYQIAKKRCLVVKFIDDIRYDHLAKEDGIVTHDEIEYKGFDIVKCRCLSEISLDKIIQYDIIGVDEGQFYDDILIVDKWANMGKLVIVSALDGTFQKKPFGRIHELIPMSEKVTKCTAVCSDCGEDAVFTKRIVAVSGDPLRDIGGVEKYRAVCRACYEKNA